MDYRAEFIAFAEPLGQKLIHWASPDAAVSPLAVSFIHTIALHSLIVQVFLYLLGMATDRVLNCPCHCNWIPDVCALWIRKLRFELLFTPFFLIQVSFLVAYHAVPSCNPGALPVEVPLQRYSDHALLVYVH